MSLPITQKKQTDIVKMVYDIYSNIWYVFSPVFMIIALS